MRAPGAAARTRDHILINGVLNFSAMLNEPNVNGSPGVRTEGGDCTSGDSASG
jgi:hypothetical protein